MAGVDSLPGLNHQIEADPITLQPAACLNSRFRATGCTRCADMCPAEAAITLTEGQPEINNGACLHCGLCLHRCPTGAFTRPDSFSGQLNRTTAAIPTGPVELVCPQQLDPAVGPTSYAIQTQRCLAAISAATLLALVIDGKDIWLDDSYCVACPLGKVQPALAQTVAEANSWAVLVANAGRIYLHSEQPAAPAVPRQLLDATRPPVSRRGLLDAFRSHVAAGTQPAAAELIKPGREVSPAQRLPQALPPERTVILNLLAQHPPAEAGAPVELPVATVQVDRQHCTACGLCAKFCPTGALKFLSDDRTFALMFHPDRCLGQVCDICRRACPERAVTTAPVLNESLPKKPLAAGDLTPCARCQTSIAHGPDLPATCFACRSQVGPAGLLASLENSE